MKLKAVRYFLAICEQGTFTSAAKTCGVSQPSLSNAINRLERKLGGLLFHREANTVRLSKLGRTLRPSLKKLDENAASIYRVARSLAETNVIE
jgi:DNA-binding transcriptional LysR family regulator